MHSIFETKRILVCVMLFRGLCMPKLFSFNLFSWPLVSIAIVQFCNQLFSFPSLSHTHFPFLLNTGNVNCAEHFINVSWDAYLKRSTFLVWNFIPENWNLKSKWITNLSSSKCDRVINRFLKHKFFAVWTTSLSSNKVKYEKSLWIW